ncbi:hypothetical protein BC833DRAFT_583224 [Globomyces pollinis-pini]|nr:hypothetical protein BC833DRAFT_583224 [Globomyces pollinis-pini]
MMATLGETIAFEVVLGVWNQLVDHAEAMIVPSLGDDPKDRKQWDIRRFNFFLKFMEIATEFFVVDGEGLDVETLETPSYQSLKSIMENYFKTKSELQEEYLALEDRSDANWMLKLIKMKGGKDFVDDMLRTLIQT